MDKQRLRAELEDLWMAMPPEAQRLSQPNSYLGWFGRAMAILREWNFVLAIGPAKEAIDSIRSGHSEFNQHGIDDLKALLHEARHDLMMRTTGPLNVAVEDPMVFEYFDHIRKIIEAAKQEIYFVDPYLDAEFVSRYLPYVGTGVGIRLLADKKIGTLVPAAQQFAAQSKAPLEIRSSTKLHDRFVFVDGASCYQSGASFKDGAKKALATINQVTDAFDAIAKAYEKMWQSAKKELVENAP